jgi:RNA polymerase sigma factor (sigma-70 family)
MAHRGGLRELGPAEKRRFITASIRQAILRDLIIRFGDEMNPRKNPDKIKAEAKDKGVSMAEVKDPWEKRWRRLKTELLEEYASTHDLASAPLSQDELDYFYRLLKNPHRDDLHAVKGQPGKVGRRAYEGVDIEDLRMDAITKLGNQPDFLLPEYGQNAMAWLTSVLWNAIRDVVRAEKNHTRILHQSAMDPEHWLSATRLNESAERAALRHLEELEIMKAIFRLPDHLASVAYFRYQGYEPIEIAGILGISPNAVKMRLRTIRNKKIRPALDLYSLS